jgi:hypothetical protein
MKATVILFGLVLLSYILLNLRDILVPLASALLLAIGINTKKQNEYINEAGTNLKPVLTTAMGTNFGGLAGRRQPVNPAGVFMMDGLLFSV